MSAATCSHLFIMLKKYRKAWLCFGLFLAHYYFEFKLFFQGTSTSVSPPDYTCTPDQIHILCQCCLQPMPNGWPDTLARSIPAQKCKYWVFIYSVHENEHSGSFSKYILSYGCVL